MDMQLIKVINGPKPKSALALIIEDDGSIENPGQLILDDFSEPEVKSNRIFFNGDSIYDVWVSPAGDIWVSSCFGNIYTTANVTFPKSPVKSPYNLKHKDVRNSGYNWKMYTLGAVVSADTIYSPDGIHVFIGTYSGHIFFWDGKNWTKQETPTSLNNENYIYQLAGTTVNNVFAIGNMGSGLFHYNGKTWKNTAFDEEKYGSITPHGLLQHPDGYLYLACEGGRIWKTRDGRQFDLVAKDAKLDLSGIAYAHGQIILAAGEKGVYAYKDGKLKNIRNTFTAETVTGHGNQAVFIRPSTETKDIMTVAYAVYSDSPEMPWEGFTIDFDK